MAKHNVYRDRKVHVCEQMCDTCIFRPGNLMNLEDGRVKQMVEESTAEDGCIPCHKTLDGDNAVCHGFFSLHKTGLLQVAERLEFIEWV